MAAGRKTILIIDDDEGTRETLGVILRADFRLLFASSGEGGLALMQAEHVDLVLLDVRLPGIGGLDVLTIAKENYPLCEVIVISAVRELECAVTAMQRGAYHYVTKEFDYDAVRSLVTKAIERQSMNRQVLRLSAEVEDATGREFVAGASPAMHAVMAVIEKVAPLPATVLILGESGTGKELLARHIHERSGAAADAPFVAVNVAAIPRELVESTLFGHERGAFTGAVKQQIGKFELASGGTLFLDEIGDLRADLQAKLLRALQEGEIERVGGTRPIRTDFRLIAATNMDLQQAVREGRFREDLFYRLNVVPVNLPPLRDRLADLPELARVFIRRYAARFHKPVTDISDSTLAILQAHRWPGNIRELENLIARLVALADSEWITDADLPYEMHVARAEDAARGNENRLDIALAAFERNFLIRALERGGWNIAATARALGIPLSTLKHKMDRLEVRQVVRPTPGREQTMH
ncbi:MAG: sigma-54-dependent transcriptional regulator [Vicinamibacterales bacterium]